MCAFKCVVRVCVCVCVYSYVKQRHERENNGTSSLLKTKQNKKKTNKAKIDGKYVCVINRIKVLLAFLFAAGEAEFGGIVLDLIGVLPETEAR